LISPARTTRCFPKHFWQRGIAKLLQLWNVTFGSGLVIFFAQGDKLIEWLGEHIEEHFVFD
jgi:hypothetical protein